MREHGNSKPQFLPQNYYTLKKKQSIVSLIEEHESYNLNRGNKSHIKYFKCNCYGLPNVITQVVTI